MGSQNPLGFYDKRTLSVLHLAFGESWAAITAREPCPTWERDSDLRTALARKLTRLVDKGVSDPAELRDKTLRSWRSTKRRHQEITQGGPAETSVHSRR